jgi:putative salt-induced outer membrane protein YdiY
MTKKWMYAVVMASVVLNASAVRAQESTEAPKWAGNMFVGYNMQSGNTKKAAGNISAAAARKVENGELSLKGNISYSESNNTMDGQKWDALARYALDFGRDNNWYNFYQVYVDHDYFADVDYRITPSAGLGYHIVKSEDFIWDADGGIGYRITKHRTSNSTDNSATALVHTFLKKSVFEKAALSEDLTVYPGLAKDAGVLIRSETGFTNPLSEKFDLQLKYIVDHNTEPGVGKKKTDTQFIAGLNYKF